jgi:nucleotide-binding universal stress UspA family protein
MTETIVVGYDGSRAAEKALEQAVAEAKRRGGSRILIACGHQQPFGRTRVRSAERP